MIRVRALPVRVKLALTFLAVVLPLLCAEILAIGSFRASLRRSAEVELTNVVNHLFHLCAVKERLGKSEAAGSAGSGPTAGDLRFVREVFQTLPVGSTGYPYCMDTRGTLVIHPSKQGQNIYGSQDSRGFHFIQAICKQARRLAPGEVGTIRYPWKNEEAGERTARSKILLYRYFAPWDWVIAAGSYEEEIYGAVRRAAGYTAPLVLMSIFLVAGLSLGFSRMITKPLGQVSEAASRMAAGDLSHRVTVSREDEFGALARSFNAMADEIRDKTEGLERLVEQRTEALRQSQAQLVQTVKLRALGDLVSGVAHEVNNPLMASMTTLHTMTEEADCPDACPNRRRMKLLQRCNERIAKIVDHLREFSRQTRMEPTALDVNRPLENALILVGQQLLNLEIEIEKDLAPDLPAVLGDANYLEQVFLNLIGNARDAVEGTDGRRMVCLRSSVAVLDGKPAVAVSISDTGPGIPADVRDKIFEPFFTTKEAGKGTGLGLSLSYGIVGEHGGRIDVESPSGGGAMFTVLLPALAGSSTGKDRET